jgi:membrane glycosyltransferase
MLFHSKFVVLTLLGREINWNAQSRDDHGTSWREGFNAHGFGMVMAVIAGVAAYIINAPFSFWLAPVFTSLVLGPITSVWTSRRAVGLWFKKRGLMLIPEEVDPPVELARLKTILPCSKRGSAMSAFECLQGFARAVVDPAIHALHLAFLRRRRSLAIPVVEHRRELAKRALSTGPQTLSAEEKMQLLKDPDRLADLHRAVWRIADPEKAALWGIAEARCGLCETCPAREPLRSMPIPGSSVSNCVGT